jgi:hypothetical protein
MNRYPPKGWMECRACKKDDPCLMFMPKKLRKAFPKKYCYLAETNDDMIGKGCWKKPVWAKTELTV